VEAVNKFKYVGAGITSEGRCDTKLGTRIGTAKDAFSRRKVLLLEVRVQRLRRGL